MGDMGLGGRGDRRTSSSPLRDNQSAPLSERLWANGWREVGNWPESGVGNLCWNTFRDGPKMAVQRSSPTILFGLSCKIGVGAGLPFLPKVCAVF